MLKTDYEETVVTSESSILESPREDLRRFSSALPRHRFEPLPLAPQSRSAGFSSSPQAVRR